MHFSKGSVVAVYDIEFGPLSDLVAPDSDNMTRLLQMEIRQNGGKLGNFTLGVEEIKHQALSAESQDDDDMATWIIAVIACGGVILILIIFMVAVVCSRRSVNKKYTLEDDAEDSQYKRSWASGSHGNSSSSPSLPEDPMYDNAGFDHYAQPAQPAPGQGENYDMREKRGTGVDDRTHGQDKNYANVNQEGQTNPAFSDPDMVLNGYHSFTPPSLNSYNMANGDRSRKIVYKDNGTIMLYDIDKDAWETHL